VSCPLPRAHPPPRQGTRHAVAAFLSRGGRLLLLRRGPGGPWDAPGGTLELSPPAQALRELRRETGLREGEVELVRAGEPVAVPDDPPGGTRIVHPFLFLLLDPGAARLEGEHPEGRWVEPAELASLETTPGLAPLLARVWPA